MSYYQELRLVGSVILNNPTNDVFDISTESILNKSIQFLKTLIKKVIAFSKRVFDWIKNKVLKWLEYKSKNNKYYKLSLILSQLDPVDLAKLCANYFGREVSLEEAIPLGTISSFFQKDRMRFINLLFDDNGKLFDLSKIINVINEERKSKTNSTDLFLSVLNKFADSSKLPNTITKEELFKYANNLDKLLEKAKKFHIDSRKSINVNEIINLENKLKSINFISDNEEYNKILNKCHRIHSELKVALLPYNVIMLYIRLLDYIGNTNTIKPYIETKITNEITLYHISDNDSLPSILNPRIPISGIEQLLPNRISFSTDVLKCCIGIPRYFLYKDGVDTIGSYRDLYLYKAINVKGLYQIDPKIINVLVMEGTMTKEVSIVSPVNIQLLGKVRIWFNFSKHLFDPTKFIKYELIN